MLFETKISIYWDLKYENAKIGKYYLHLRNIYIYIKKIFFHYAINKEKLMIKIQW